MLWDKLPAEIWIIVLRQAMFVPWTEDDFFPPPYNRYSLDGFARAFPIFNNLVELVAGEYASCEVDVDEAIDEGILKRVK